MHEVISGKKVMAKQKASERKRGRPPLPPKQRKRNNVTIRLRDDLKSSLQEAGVDQGRSLSEEIEARLEASLLGEAAFGGRELQTLFRLLGTVAEVIQEQSGKKWNEDWETSIAVRTAWNRLIADVMPPVPLSEKKITARVDKLEAEIPQLPELPEPPVGPGLLTLPTDKRALKEHYAVMAKAFIEHRQILEKHGKRLEKARRDLRPVIERMQFAVDIGKDAAAGLLPQKTSGKVSQ